MIQELKLVMMIFQLKNLSPLVICLKLFLSLLVSYRMSLYFNSFTTDLLSSSSKFK